MTAGLRESDRSKTGTGAANECPRNWLFAYEYPASGHQIATNRVETTPSMNLLPIAIAAISFVASANKTGVGEIH